MSNEKNTKNQDIKDKMFNIKGLFLSCYGDEQGRYFFDVFYLNKNSEFIDIELHKKLILNDKPLDKEAYKDSLMIDDNVKYADYLKERFNGKFDNGNNRDEYDQNTICSTYKIEIDKNNYYLEKINITKTDDIKDKDFCIAPLFLRYYNAQDGELESTELGYPFYIIEKTKYQDKKIKNFINSIEFNDDKISYKDVIRTKNFINKLSKEYYDSFYDIEENEF